MKPIVIVKTGSTLPALAARRGDYEDWIGDHLGRSPVGVVPVNVEQGEALPGLEALVGVVVTGSSAMVSERVPWSERAGAWLAQVVRSGTPVLGICYGHQLLAQTLGGRVGPNPRGREIGTVRVSLATDLCEGDRLLGGLPPELVVQVTHRESVLTLPPGAVRLGGNAADPNQAVRFADRAWGVQFHPEFDAEVSRSYLTARRVELIAEGLDPDALLRATADSPDGARLLARFGEIVSEHERAEAR